MSVRAMLTLRTLKELHTKYVDFGLAYTQDYVNSDISRNFPYDLGLRGTIQENG